MPTTTHMPTTPPQAATISCASTDTRMHTQTHTYAHALLKRPLLILTMNFRLSHTNASACRTPTPPPVAHQRLPPLGDAQGRTPLDTACFRGHPACTDTLIERRADLDNMDETTKRTPLMVACMTGQAQVKRPTPGRSWPAVKPALCPLVTLVEAVLALTRHARDAADTFTCSHLLLALRDCTHASLLASPYSSG